MYYSISIHITTNCILNKTIVKCNMQLKFKEVTNEWWICWPIILWFQTVNHLCVTKYFITIQILGLSKVQCWSEKHLRSSQGLLH